MEAEDLLERYDAPAPVGAVLYQLTDRGRDLQGVLHALARWGLERMQAGVEPEDAAQPQWTALFAAMELSPRVDPRSEVVVGLETGGEPIHAILRHDSFEIRRGTSPNADVTLSGPPMPVGAVLSGQLTPDQAVDLGLEIAGTPSVLTDLLRVSTQPPVTSGATP